MVRSLAEAKRQIKAGNVFINEILVDDANGKHYLQQMKGSVVRIGRREWWIGLPPPSAPTTLDETAEYYRGATPCRGGIETHARDLAIAYLETKAKLDRLRQAAAEVVALTDANSLESNIASMMPKGSVGSIHVVDEELQLALNKLLEL